HFKEINDTRGHADGDAVLREMAARFKRHVRATDTVARIGGDEFVIILEGLRGADEVALIAAKLVEAGRQPFILEEDGVSLSISLGIGLASPNRHNDKDALMLE
ncbi:GGDEF domain-containing protein, partial [Escherichia coli]|uniref:GGDEF domain-containing protein n=1 Tax=Escherichia coli TaxID=562 RepID=UPI00321B253D